MSVEAFERAARDVDARGYAVLQDYIGADVASGLFEEARKVIAGTAQSQTKSGADGLYMRNIMNAFGTAEPAADGRASYHVEHVFRHVEAFRSLLMDAAIVALARAALKDTPVVLDDQLYWKPRGFGGETYLHRDSDFFGPLKVVTIWIPLTAVDEQSGCLWFAPGSRAGTDEAYSVRRRTWQASDDPSRERRFDYFYEIDESKLVLEPARASPGDVVVLNSEVLHASNALAPDRERVSYLAEYVSYASWQRWRGELSGLFAYHDRQRHMFVCTS